MKPASIGVILTIAAAIAGPAAPPARADFYQLEGRFQCLATPAAICGDATRVSVAKPVAPTPVIAPPTSPPMAALPPIAEPTGAPPAQDPVLAIAADVELGHLTAADIATLQADAAADDPRATELLAWCEFTGLGMQRDPVDAYLLYGRAASAMVPHASENQTAIYETVLTQEQRQYVLDLSNDALARAQLAAGD